jgi:ribonuclease D
MQAARVLDLPSFALAYLLDAYCGETADKQHQLADWRVGGWGGIHSI